MATLKSYIVEGRSVEAVWKATDIEHLRRQLVRSNFPNGSKIKVYNKDKSKLLGEYHQGSYEGLWKTPKGKFYSLFKDGSFRGAY